MPLGEWGRWAGGPTRRCRAAGGICWQPGCWKLAQASRLRYSPAPCPPLCPPASGPCLCSICMWELLTWQVPYHEYGPWQVVAMVTESAKRPEVGASRSALPWALQLL
jgi:hypothetical protein